MFRVLDLDFHLNRLAKGDLPWRVTRQGIRPGDLAKPELASVRAALEPDWKKLDAICSGTVPEAPDKDVLCLVNPRFGGELMELSESPRWREELRAGLDVDGALLFPEQAQKAKKKWWNPWSTSRAPAPEGAESEAFVPPPEAPEAVVFSALDVAFAPGVRPTAEALDAAAVTLGELKKLIGTNGGQRVPTTSLPELNGGAIRRLSRAGVYWQEILGELLEYDEGLLARLKNLCVAEPRPAAEQGFTGEVWEPKAEAMLHGAMAQEAAHRLALQRREKLGAGTSLAVWWAAFEEAVEAPLRRLPDARLRGVRSLALAEGDAKPGVRVGVAAPGFLRLEVVAPGVAALKLVADWLPLENDRRAASRLLAVLKKARDLPALGTVRHLAQAWAALAPMKPWPELVAALAQPDADTLAELACHHAELRAAADSGGATLDHVLHGLPGVLTAARWPSSLDNAKQVFMALSPAGERLTKSLMAAAARLQAGSEFTVSHLADVAVLARSAALMDPALDIAEEVCTLGGRFGCPVELARHLLDALQDNAQLGTDTQRLLGALCRRVLSQAGGHGMTLREVISGPLHSLLMACEPVEGLGEPLLAAIAEHLRDTAPSDLPQRWNPPSDLRAEPWLEALVPLANLSAQLHSTRCSETELVLIWGWLESTDPRALPAEAPGAFYLTLQAWLAAKSPMAGKDRSDLASHASRYQFLRALHAAAPAGEERATWLQQYSKLVPWSGLGREWLFVCASASDATEAVRLWNRGIELLRHWGRLASTADWLLALGETKPWTKPAWRELVPAFVDSVAGTFPLNVADEVVKELYTVPHDDLELQALWLGLLKELPPELSKTAGVVASIESGAASAVCKSTDDAVLSAEGALSALGHHLLSEYDNEQAEQWRRVLPDGAEKVSARLPLRASFLSSKLVTDAKHDLFVQRLRACWSELVSDLFSQHDSANFDEIWALARNVNAPMDELKRGAGVRLVNDISRLPIHQAASALLRLLRGLPDAVPQVFDHATLLRSILTWMLSSADAMKLWTPLTALLNRPISEGMALGVAADHLRAKGGKVSSAELAFLSSLRLALSAVLPAIEKQVQGDLRDRLLATLLCTPDAQLSTAWRRQIADEYHALLHSDPAAAAAVAQLTALLS